MCTIMLDYASKYYHRIIIALAFFYDAMGFKWRYWKKNRTEIRCSRNIVLLSTFTVDNSVEILYITFTNVVVCGAVI
jgi:hypothetical protein